MSDKRVSKCDSELAIEYFEAEVLTAMDYYPFGMMMPDRQYYANNDSSSYSFGFGGQMKDDEISGIGNSISFKYRVHDVRLGRFMSVDPLEPEYPWNSTYAFAENRVIDGIELEGLEVMMYGWKSQLSCVLTGTVSGGIVVDAQGNVFGFGSWGVGIETNISASAGYYQAYFPSKKMTAADVAGFGFSTGCSANAPVSLTVGLSYIKSGEFDGIGAEFGAGGSVMPMSCDITFGKTYLQPVGSQEELLQAKTIIGNSISNFSRDLSAKITQYCYVSDQMKECREQMSKYMAIVNDKDAKNEDRESNLNLAVALNSKMKELSKTITSLEEEIEGKIEVRDNMNKSLETIELKIEELKKKESD